MKASNRTIVLLLFLLALAVRLAYLFYFGPLEQIPPDTGYYALAAKDLLEGTFPYKGLYGIGYVAFLSLVFSIFGVNNFLAVEITQAFIGSFTVALCYAIGKRIYNRFTGIVAGLLTAFMPTLIFWTRYVLTETIFIFLLILLVWLLIRFIDELRFKYVLFSSVVFILMALTRTAAVLILPFALFWLFLVYKSEKLVPFKWTATALSVAFLFFLPYLVCNFGISGKVVSNPKGLVDRFQGNITMGLQWNEVGRATRGIDIGQDEGLPGYVNEYKGRPYKMANLMWRKLKTFWWLYTPQMSKRHSLIRLISLVPVYTFGLVGLFFAKKVWRKLTLLVILILGFTLPPVLTVVDYDLRYHLPVESLCIIISAYGVSVLWEKLLNWKRYHLYQ